MARVGAESCAHEPHDPARRASFLAQAARRAAIGGLLGLFGAYAAARVSATLLFGVGTLDLWTMAVVLARAAVMALIGGYFPARRASTVSPAEILRD